MNGEISNLQRHAERELRALGYPIDTLETAPDDPNKWVCENILELLTTFSNQGHSGSSAPYVIALFAKLANWEPACPLTGADDEWMEVGPGVLQNIRCSTVFKDKTTMDGQPYDINAVIFREPNGVCYTNGNSRRVVTFPYTPKSEYVDVPAKAC